jgi:hypothetical protein
MATATMRHAENKLRMQAPGTLHLMSKRFAV